MKIIDLVLKRKDWGKKYTLYKTTTHEVLTQMRSYKRCFYLLCLGKIENIRLYQEQQKCQA